VAAPRPTSPAAPSAPALERPPIAAATWATYVQQVEAAPPLPAARTAALLAAFERANRAEVASKGEVTAQATQAAADLAENAWQFAQLHTPDAYVALGPPPGPRAARMPRRAPGVVQGAWQDPRRGPHPRPSAAGSPWWPWGGPFLQFAEGAGLIANGQVVPGHEPFLQAVFLQHWIAPLRGRMPLDASLSGDERTWFLRWKVELQTTGPLERRLAAADELAVLRDYPADLNAGVLLMQAGRRSEAAERFARSKHPKAAEYLKILERGP
jgi:hypothetical protein